MSHFAHNFWHNTLRYIDHMGYWEWAMVLGAMIGVAALCMRGFGSRSQY